MTRRLSRTTIVVTGSGFIAGCVGFYAGINTQSTTIGGLSTLVVCAVLLWLGFAHD